MRSFYDSRKIAAEWCGCRSRRSLDVGPEQECSTARPDQEWFINNTGNWIPLQNSSALVENANPIATRLLPMRRRNSPRSRNGRKSCFYLLHWLKKLRLHVHLLILILLFLVYGSLSLSLFQLYGRSGSHGGRRLSATYPEHANFCRNLLSKGPVT